VRGCQYIGVVRDREKEQEMLSEWRVGAVRRGGRVSLRRTNGWERLGFFNLNKV
jgi:hypothetical protein